MKAYFIKKGNGNIKCRCGARRAKHNSQFGECKETGCKQFVWNDGWLIKNTLVYGRH